MLLGFVPECMQERMAEIESGICMLLISDWSTHQSLWWLWLNLRMLQMHKLYKIIRASDSSGLVWEQTVFQLSFWIDRFEIYNIIMINKLFIRLLIICLTPTNGAHFRLWNEKMPASNLARTSVRTTSFSHRHMKPESHSLVWLTCVARKR